MPSEVAAHTSAVQAPSLARINYKASLTEPQASHDVTAFWVVEVQAQRKRRLGIDGLTNLPLPAVYREILEKS